jgi:hypothetical protein
MTDRMIVEMSIPPILDENPGDLKRNVWGKAVKSGLRDGAEWFLQKRLMKRFQHNLTTARDLKWMIRDLKYNRRKQALRNAYGRDQWFRGSTQRQAELTRRQGVDGSGVKITPKRLTILIRNLGQQYVRRKNRMNLREELERISGHEVRAVSILIGRGAATFINEDPRARRKARRKIT